MGKCKLCGKETNNKYDFYTADKVSPDGNYEDVVYETRQTEQNLAGVYHEYSVAFANFEKQTGFICTVCANKGKGPVLVVAGILFALIGVLTAGLVIIFGATEMITISLITLIAGVAILYIGINMKKIGKPLSTNRGSALLVSLEGGTFFHNGKIERMDKGEKVLFSLKYYENCKKNAKLQ